jgi:Flp pilus assembly protein TadB
LAEVRVNLKNSSLLVDLPDKVWPQEIEHAPLGHGVQEGKVVVVVDVVEVVVLVVVVVVVILVVLVVVVVVVILVVLVVVLVVVVVVEVVVGVEQDSEILYVPEPS